MGLGYPPQTDDKAQEHPSSDEPPFKGAYIGLHVVWGRGVIERFRIAAL